MNRSSLLDVNMLVEFNFCAPRDYVKRLFRSWGDDCDTFTYRYGESALYFVQDRIDKIHQPQPLLLNFGEHYTKAKWYIRDYFYVECDKQWPIII